MTDRNAALKLAGDLAVSYPGRNVTEDHARAWAELLERTELDVAAVAVRHLRERSSDPPSVAQLVSAIAEVQQTTMSPRVEQAELGEEMDPADIRKMLEALRSVPGCPECGVPHISRTHDEHIARSLAAARRFHITKAGRR